MRKAPAPSVSAARGPGQLGQAAAAPSSQYDRTVTHPQSHTDTNAAWPPVGARHARRRGTSSQVSIFLDLLELSPVGLRRRLVAASHPPGKILSLCLKLRRSLRARRLARRPSCPGSAMRGALGSCGARTARGSSHVLPRYIQATCPQLRDASAMQPIYRLAHTYLPAGAPRLPSWRCR